MWHTVCSLFTSLCTAVELQLPVDKLSCKLTARSSKPGSYRPVVLVSCGSFNPPTFMHLRMFDIAAHRLAQEGYDVLGGYMSPVNDAYSKAGLVSAEHRVNMCRLASADSPLVMIDGWEAAQPQYQNSLFVLRHVAARLQDSLQGESSQCAASAGRPDAAGSQQGGAQSTLAESGSLPAPRAMLLCGADLLESFVKPGVWREGHVQQILEQHGVVCIARKGSDAEALLAREGTVLHKFSSRVIIVTDPVQNDTSSTVVRNELAQGRPVRYLTPSSVIEYIQQHGLYSG